MAKAGRSSNLHYFKEVLDFLRDWEDKEAKMPDLKSREEDIMRKNTGLLACAIAMLIIVLTLTVTTAAADQLSGTWKMNPGKSGCQATILVASLTAR